MNPGLSLCANLRFSSVVLNEISRELLITMLFDIHMFLLALVIPQILAHDIKISTRIYLSL